MVVTDNNGVSTEYGFSPAESGSLFGPGKVSIITYPENDDHEYQFSLDPIELTDQQLQDLMDFIKEV